MTDIVGYLALGLGLFAISKKNMITFRLWHIASAVCYILFGLLLSAIPIITGGVLFLLIHLYKLSEAKSKLKKFLIIEHFSKDKVKDLYIRFEKNGRMLPKGVHFIDSWIDKDVNTCYQLMESENIDKISDWISNWNDLADFEVVSVIDSKLAKEIVFDL